MNFKGFILLGLLFAVVFISSTVGADQKSKDERKVVDGAAEKTKQESVNDEKYIGGGCGGCCHRYGFYGCGPRHCCAGTEADESKAVDETSQTKPDGWGGHGGGGHGGGGHGGGGHGGGGHGGGGHGGGGKDETSQTKPDGWGGHGGGGHGGGGHGGGGKDDTSQTKPDGWGGHGGGGHGGGGHYGGGGGGYGGGGRRGGGGN